MFLNALRILLALLGLALALPAHAQEVSFASTLPPSHVPRASQPARVREYPAVGPLSIGAATYFAYRFEGHVHTSHSPDARHDTLEVLAEAERLGLDALVITDHGASLARFDFHDYHGKLTPFVGREIGGDFGHAVMWNVVDDTLQNPRRTTLRERSEFAHGHGGLLVFAHPGWWIDGNDRDPMRWMTPEAMRRGGVAGDVDAIELWNGVYYAPLPKLIEAWTALLDAGVFVPIVGNSDYHREAFHHLGNAHNIALCDRPEIATCLWPAVREGRVIVTDGPAAVFSVNDAPPGAVVDPAGAALRVSIDALAPEGGTLRVYLGHEIVKTVSLERGVRAQASFEIASPTEDSYVRVDIQRRAAVPKRPAISLLSNPVLIDVGPRRTSWR